MNTIRFEYRDSKGQLWVADLKNDMSKLIATVQAGYAHGGGIWITSRDMDGNIIQHTKMERAK